MDFLETDTVKNLVKKYSQFINFPIYLWNSKTIEVEEAVEEDELAEKEKKEDEIEDEAQVEEEKEEKPKTKKVEKTVWDWEILNDSKPIWTRKANEIKDSEYEEFYKALTKDTKDALMKIHFVAEGEVTFKSVLFVPQNQPSESFNKYGTKVDNIKVIAKLFSKHPPFYNWFVFLYSCTFVVFLSQTNSLIWCPIIWASFKA